MRLAMISTIGGAVVAACAAAIFAWHWRAEAMQATARAASSWTQAQDCAARMAELQRHADSLQTRVAALGLSEVEVRNLRRQGLPDPVAALAADLQQHPELIPYPGVLGGTMRYDGADIHILGARWVHARFEDGHIAGEQLLEYEVRPGGKISWKPMAARPR